MGLPGTEESNPPVRTRANGIRQHCKYLIQPPQEMSVYVHDTRAVRKVSGYFEYLEKRLRCLDITWHPIRGDITVLS